MCIICQQFKVIHRNLASNWGTQPGHGPRQHGCLQHTPPSWQWYVHGGLFAPQTETWHFDVGCLRFASLVHQGIEPRELGQRLTVCVLKIGAVLRRLWHQVCLISSGWGWRALGVQVLWKSSSQFPGVVWFRRRCVEIPGSGNVEVNVSITVQVFSVVGSKMLFCTSNPAFGLPSIASGTVSQDFPFRKWIFLGVKIISQT